MLTLLDVSKPTLVDIIEEYDKGLTLKDKIKIEISFYKMQINIFFNDIIRGVKNIVKYFPVIWRDTPWDFEENFFRILDKKLEVTKKEIYRNSIIVDTPKVYDQISETQAYIYLYLGCTLYWVSKVFVIPKESTTPYKTSSFVSSAFPSLNRISWNSIETTTLSFSSIIPKCSPLLTLYKPFPISVLLSYPNPCATHKL